jgi:hypothetical protein
VEASNSCAGTLIFVSLFLLSSVKVFFPPLFAFFLSVLVFSPFVELVFVFIVFRFIF